MKINIFINNQKYEGELNNTETAKKIYEILPIESEGNFWGNEIYFEIPVEMANEKPTEELKVGDLAYWPEGNSFCIFYQFWVLHLCAKLSYALFVHFYNFLGGIHFVQ